MSQPTFKEYLMVLHGWEDVQGKSRTNEVDAMKEWERYKTSHVRGGIINHHLRQITIQKEIDEFDLAVKLFFENGGKVEN